MLVIFSPPAGTEPVELEGLGTTRVFYPQDQIWKKVLVQNNNFPLRDPYDRTKPWVRKNEKTEKEEQVFRKNLVKKWVVDEEKTKLLKSKKVLPPSDTYEITQDEWLLLQLGKMGEKKKWFKKTDTAGINQQAAYAQMLAEHEKKLAALAADMAAKEAEAASRIAEIDAKMAAAQARLEQNSVVESKRGR